MLNMLTNNTVKIDDVFLARRNLNFFSTYAFKEKYPNAEFHTQWYNAIQNPKITRIINIAPRNSGKTTVFGKKGPLWLLGRDQNLKILLLSRTSSRAQANLRFIRQSIESNEMVHKVFPNLKPAVPWSDDELTVENNRRDGESSVLARGLGGSITGFRSDLLDVDDLIDKTNVSTDLQREKVNAYWDEQVLPTLNPDGRVLIIGCLVAGTKITLSDGSWKNIEDFTGGERVISYDSEQVVEAMIPQGEADVYELKTRNNTIQATANHPFLIYHAGKTEFMRLDSLQKGHRLVSYNLHTNTIPNSDIDEETAWVLGFMLGDGWITHQTTPKGAPIWATCFSQKVDESKNQKMLNYFQKRFNANPKNYGYGYYRTNMRSAGIFLEKIGFKGQAKTKRIPQYVFSLPINLRQSFLDGFVAADGTKDKHNLVHIELSNIELIYDLKQLASGLGHKISNIYERTRLIQAPHSKQPIVSKTAHISFGNTKILDKFGTIEVVSVTHIGKKLVYDITVSNTHNFVAEGLVVHNTRYSNRDWYARMMESPGYKENLFIFPAFKMNENKELILDENDQPISYWKERWPVEKLLERKAEVTSSEGSIAFSAQYLCDPSGFEGQLFKSDWLRFYTGDELIGHYGDLDFVMGVDPNITAEARSDNTAIVTLAIDRKHNDVYVLDIFAQPLDFISQVKKLRELATQTQLHIGKYYIPGEQHIRKVGIESIAYQKALSATGYTMGLPVQEVIHGRTDKVTRLLRIQPHIENGRIKFPDPEVHRDLKWWAPFLDEYLSFPRGRRDDMCDALEIAISVADLAGGGSSIPFGPSGESYGRDLFDPDRLGRNLQPIKKSRI